MAEANPLAYNPDGTAVDPIAFRDALMADPEVGLSTLLTTA
jgi:hypothetical protein